MIVRGSVAEFRVGYQVAARVAPFELKEQKPSAIDSSARPKEWTFSGEVKEKSDFWCGRGPFELLVYIGATRVWKWKAVRPAFNGSRVNAVVHGEPER